MESIGSIYRDLGRHELAKQHYDQALTIQRRLDFRLGEASILCNVAILLRNQRRPGRAGRTVEQALSLSREIGARTVESDSLKFLAELHLEQGFLSTAAEYAEQALLIFRDLKDHVGEGAALGGIAKGRAQLGQIALALEHVAAGEPLMQGEAHRIERITFLGQAAAVFGLAQDHKQAQRALAEAIMVRDQLEGDNPHIAQVIGEAQALLSAQRPPHPSVPLTKEADQSR